VLAITLKDSVNEAAAKTFRVTGAEALGVGVAPEADEPPHAARSTQRTTDNRSVCRERFIESLLMKMSKEIQRVKLCD